MECKKPIQKEKKTIKRLRATKYFYCKVRREILHIGSVPIVLFNSIRNSKRRKKGNFTSKSN